MSCCGDPYSGQLKEEEEKRKKIGGMTNLSSTVRSLLHTETNKGRVSHFDQNVINTINMDGLNPPPLHVIQDTLVPESSVKTPITV